MTVRLLVENVSRGRKRYLDERENTCKTSSGMAAEKLCSTLVTVLIVDILATSSDFTLTWTSPIYPKLYSNDTSVNPLGRPITQEEDAWVGSLVNVGAVIGPLPFGLIADKIGRKVSLLCLAIPLIVSYTAMAFASHICVFYMARLFGGMTLGASYSLLPMYIAEIVEESKRGPYSVTLSVFWALGNFLPYALGPFMSVKWFNLALACFPIFFLGTFLLLGVETPYFLVAENKFEEAQEVLMLLRSSDRDGIQEEFAVIKDNIKREGNGRLTDIIKNPGMRNSLTICVALIVFQQLSGVDAISFYLEPIFVESHSGISPEYSSIAVGGCVLLSTFFVPLLVDKFSRKAMLVFSCTGTALSLAMMGAYFFINTRTNTDITPRKWMPVTSLLFFVITYELGIGVLPWTLTSELFPKHVKQVAASTVSIFCWLTSFIVTKFFNDSMDGIGSGETFWLMSGCCLICILFTIAFVPETKGKTFKEIQDMVQGTSIN